MRFGPSWAEFSDDNPCGAIGSLRRRGIPPSIGQATVDYVDNLVGEVDGYLGVGCMPAFGGVDVVTVGLGVGAVTNRYAYQLEPDSVDDWWRNVDFGADHTDEESAQRFVFNAAGPGHFWCHRGECVAESARLLVS